MTITDTAAPDLAQVKRRQQQMWASGDFHAVATLIQPVAETLCDAADLQAGWRVLDVATGSGNAAIAAARCGCEVVGIDYVPALLERGRAPRRGRGRRRSSCARATPRRSRSPTASFDAVALGLRRDVRARPRPGGGRAASASCRPGGTIALATWTPDGFIGEMLKVVAAHVPPAPGVASPLLWGSKAYVSDAVRRRDQRRWRARSGRSRSGSARPRRSSTTSARTTGRR